MDKVEVVVELVEHPILVLLVVVVMTAFLLEVLVVLVVEVMVLNPPEVVEVVMVKAGGKADLEDLAFSSLLILHK